MSFIVSHLQDAKPHSVELNPSGSSGPFALVHLDAHNLSYITVRTPAEAQAFIDVFAEARTLLIDAQNKPAEVTE
jgi:hypothetical protein